jgi:hypothetical protein
LLASCLSFKKEGDLLLWYYNSEVLHNYFINAIKLMYSWTMISTSLYLMPVWLGVLRIFIRMLMTTYWFEILLINCYNRLNQTLYCTLLGCIFITSLLDVHKHFQGLDTYFIKVNKHQMSLNRLNDSKSERFPILPFWCSFRPFDYNKNKYNKSIEALLTTKWNRKVIFVLLCRSSILTLI